MRLTDRAVTVGAASVTAAVVVVLGVVAAFGGLAAVPERELATVAVGETFAAAPLTVTVERAGLMAELPEAYLDAEAGTMLLVVDVAAVNTWTEPQYAGPQSSLSGVVSVAGLGEPEAVVRRDDGHLGPDLQPGVPVELRMAWRVDADEFGAGEPVTITLSDMTLYTASFVTAGQWWTDPVAEAVTRPTMEGVS